MSDQRQQAFQHWIAAFLSPAHRLSGPLQISALKGDAGFRRYYRLNTEPSLIAVDSPPHKEKNAAYVNIALALQAQGLRTPTLYAVDFCQGFMLLEDFGDRLLLSLLNQHSMAQFYQQAESSLLAIQQLTPDPQLFPSYNSQLLADEMALFKRWFIKELLNIQLQADEMALLDHLFSHLINSALQQPQVLVHRDYHSRNLMLLAGGELGVIDFQDAVCGPITYDLVSLLKDCYIRWPAQQVRERAMAFNQRLIANDPQLNIEEQQFLRWFDLMGLQRHIKVMGIFARLALRDGKQGYLKDLPLVIDYCLEAAEGYEETLAFANWFNRRIVPHLHRQPWYPEHRADRSESQR